MIWNRSGKFVNVMAVSVMLLSSLIPLLSTPSHAEPATGTIEVIDQEFCELDDPVQALINGNFVGQSFIPSKSVLSSVDLQLIYPSCDINVTIYKAKLNGFPDLSNPLTGIAANEFRSYGNYGFWYKFDFPDIPVIPGDTYFITVEVVDNNLPCNWVNAENGYDNGSAWAFLMSDDYGFGGGRDYFFRTYYSDTGFIPIANAGPDQHIIANTTVCFSGVKSYDPDGTIVKYSWNLGNSIILEGATVQYCFNLPGTYTVSLIVSDDDGLTDTDYCIITVLEFIPPNQPPVPIIEVNGYLGHYYNLPANHSEVGGSITGIVTGDSPFNHDWYSDQYYSFTKFDPNLTFGNDFFPVNEGMPGDPLYFAVHWETNISMDVSGNCSFEIGSDDDSWVYIDDQMVCDLGGIHALAISTHTTYLTTGQHKLDIYFAERRSVQSGFYFKFVDNEIESSASIRLSNNTGMIRINTNQTIGLSATHSYDTDGDVLNYTWDFGDGTRAFGENVSHDYSNEGNYTITLTILDDEGGISKEILFLMVAPVFIPLIEASWEIIESQPNEESNAPLEDTESGTLETQTNSNRAMPSIVEHHIFSPIQIIVIVVQGLLLFTFARIHRKGDIKEVRYWKRMREGF